MTGAPGFDDVVVGRRSIRGFLDKPVPKTLIAEILGVAMRAPSSFNNQCWNFSVVTGEPLAAIRRGNTDGILAGKPDSREFRRFDGIADDHRARQVEIAKQLFGAMGIARDDKDARQDWVLRGFRQFDAPVSVVVTYDRVLLGSDIAPFDCGAVTNALVFFRAVFQIVIIFCQTDAVQRNTPTESLTRDNTAADQDSDPGR